MNVDASRLFAELFVNTKYEDLPSDVVEAVKTQILDYFGVCLTGSEKDGAKQVREVAIEMGGVPHSTILGTGEKVPAPNAAQANATAAHSLDFDDVHEAAIMHPGVVTISTALAAGEMVGGISGKELITAVALGGDMICRLGLAVYNEDSNPHKYGWHFTSLYSYMTSAAVASRVLGLSVDQTVYAMGIAYHQCGGNGQAVKDSALTKRLGPGMGCRAGLHAALLAKKGVTGATNPMEGVQGLFNTYHQGKYSREILIGNLGQYFETVNVSIKPYPACRGTHPSIDSALKLAKEYGVNADNIKSILIEAGKGTIGLLGEPLSIKAHPNNVVDAQFSMAWGVSSAIARKCVTLNDYTETAIKDPVTLNIASKVGLKHNPEFDTGGLEPVRITAETVDGQTYSVYTKEATGSPTKPVTYDECGRKFRECLSCATNKLGDDKINNIIETIRDLDSVDNLEKLISYALWD